VTLGLDDVAVQNMLAYGLATVIEDRRIVRDEETGAVVHELPWALCAAIGHAESEHDPFVFNYHGAQHMERGRWDGDPATIPDGTGGRPNAWAVGWLQIIRKFPRGLSLPDRFIAALEARVLFPEWQHFYDTSKAAGLTGRDLYAAVYFGHNQGSGRLAEGLPHAAKGIVSIINNSGLTEAADAQAALVVAIKVAGLVSQYAALEEQIKAAAPGMTLAGSPC
jgi:hypothetical protein